MGSMRSMAAMKLLLADTALAVTLAVLGVVSTGLIGTVSEEHAPVGVLALSLAGAAGLVLVVRRRWPLVTLAAATLLTTTYLILDYPYGPFLASFAVAVYTVARHLPLSWSAPAALVVLPVLLIHTLFNSASLSGFTGAIPGTAWVAVPFAIGVTVRARQEVAARARAEVIRAQVDDERLRVAQEVHDIVGHGLAAIKMQADVALHVLAKPAPEPAERAQRAQQALDAISRTSGEALAELRVTLAAVRDSGTGSERSPGPGLDRVAELRQRMGEAGLRVRLETAGQPRELPPVVDLTGYRVVQESLTNALRHGGSGEADVTIWYRDGTVEVTVSNPADGVPAQPGGSGSDGGSGIEGMRKRVEALAGSFSAGPTADGRFEVRAAIPTGGAA